MHMWIWDPLGSQILHGGVAGKPENEWQAHGDPQLPPGQILQCGGISRQQQVNLAQYDQQTWGLGGAKAARNLGADWGCWGHSTHISCSKEAEHANEQFLSRPKPPQVGGGSPRKSHHHMSKFSWQARWMSMNCHVVSLWELRHMMRVKKRAQIHLLDEEMRWHL